MSPFYQDIEALLAEAVISDDQQSISFRERSAFYDPARDSWWIRDRRDPDYALWCGDGNTQTVREGVVRELERVTRQRVIAPTSDPAPAF